MKGSPTKGQGHKRDRLQPIRLVSEIDESGTPTDDGQRVPRTPGEFFTRRTVSAPRRTGLGRVSLLA